MQNKICKFCKNIFVKKPKNSYKFFAQQKFCCHKCFAKSMKGVSKNPEHRIGKHKLRIQNKYYINKDTITVIKNQNGKKYVILMSLSDLDIVKNYTFVVTNYVRVYINGKNINISNLIMPPKNGFIVDHINRNKLDNRRENLRYATNQQNMFNRICKGYSFDSSRNLYISSIKINGKTKHLGRFRTPEEAQKAHRKASIKFFGEFSPYLKM